MDSTRYIDQTNTHRAPLIAVTVIFTLFGCEYNFLPTPNSRLIDQTSFNILQSALRSSYCHEIGRTGWLCDARGMGKLSLLSLLWASDSQNKIASIGYTIASSLGIRYGVGLLMRPSTTKQIDPSKAIEVRFATHPCAVLIVQLIHVTKATYYVEIFYYFSIYLIKMSILLFYLRLSK
jgi:hypothetical protein